MTIRFECRTCGSAFRVPDNYAGRNAICKTCAAKITVPAKSIVPPPRQDRAIIVETVDPENAWDRLEKRINGQPPGPPSAPDRASSGSPARPEYGRRWIETDRAASRRWILWVSLAAGGLILFVVLMFVAVGIMLRGGPGRTFDFTSIQAPPPSFSPPRPMPSADGRVVWKEVRLSGAGQPGQSGRLWVYLPVGEHAPGSLPCVLIAPAGSNLLCGMGLGAADQPEHYPYAESGIAVVAFELDGPLENIEAPQAEEMMAAYDEFSAAGAGIVNARNAFLYASTQIPEVDPQRIYIAGHSSAASLSLLYAAHEPRLAGAIAYAPCTDLVGRYGLAGYQLALVLPGCRSFLAAASPINHVKTIRCPVFLFHAEDDSNVPIAESRRFAEQLRNAGGTLSFRTVATGDHYNSMIEQGVPQAIEWLRQGGQGE